MRGCTDGGANEAKCHCVWKWLDVNVPAAQRRAFEGQLAGSTPMTQVPAWAVEAARACARVASPVSPYGA
jgi:hypothetical protein